VTDVDVSALPRLGLSPHEHSAEQAVAYGLGRHPSMTELGRRTLMWNPALQEALAHLSDYLRASSCLPARDREIAILRHAWDCGADYQWAIHAQTALAAGLTPAEVGRLATEAGGWAPHEAAVIRAVDELHRASQIGDETWAGLRAHYDERQIIELIVLIGSYRTTAYVFNSVGIPPPDGHSPDLPGNTFTFVDRPAG